MPSFSRHPVLLACAAALLVSGMAASASAQRTWRVRAGDALSLVAERFDVSVDELREWNGLEDDTIFVGQELRVAAGDGPTTGRYVVRPGDTLSGIAVRLGTTVDEIVEHNPDLDPDRIRVGQELQTGRGRRVEHTVLRGESLSRIAARYGVTVQNIRDWNPDLRPNVLRAGRTLTIFTDEPESRSVSVGAPYHGRLEHAVRLHRHPAYVIRDRDKVWATEETARWIVDAFDELRRRFPDAPKVRVHDISNRRGGPMHGHRSHQSGRDVDISYYQRYCGDIPCPMWHIPADQLDVAKQWALFEHWLRNDEVEDIFMDYGLQRPLYEYARDHGATPAELRRWFQYPNGRSHPNGIIRHFPQHRDHFHVRFVCPDTDPDCR